MTKQLNKTIFVGHLGNDPEMRFTPTGKPVTNFSVGSNDQYINDQGETVKTATWYRCSSWGKAAEVHHQYLKKGSRVLIIGQLLPDPATGGPRLWTGQDDKVHASFEVTVRELYFLDSKNGNGNGGGEPPATVAEGDYPF